MGRNRTILLVGLVITGVLLLVYALFLYPQQKNRGLRLQREVRELDAMVQSSQQQVELTRAAVLELLEGGVPAQPRGQGDHTTAMIAAMRGIDEWVRKSGVVLTKLEPEPREERPPLVVHPMTLELTGGFSELCGFLNGIEQGVGIVPLQWGIESDPKAGRGLKATFRVAFYEWTGTVLDPSRKGTATVPALAFASDRDPFSKGRDPVVSPGPDTRTSTLVLTGILTFGDKRKAIINGKAYVEGEEAGGRRIRSITEDEVVVDGEVGPLRIQRALQRVAPSQGAKDKGARTE